MQDNIILLLIIALLLAIIGVGYYLYSKYISLDSDISYIKETMTQNEEKNVEGSGHLTNELLNFQEELAEYMNNSQSESGSDISEQSESDDMEAEFYKNLNNNISIEELEDAKPASSENVPEINVVEKKTRQYNKKKKIEETQEIQETN
jgi:uncharacterized protein YoxC